MPRKTPTPEALAPEATDGTLAFLRAVAGEEMFAAALPILRDRMKLTPEKVALLLLRVLNPDSRIEQGEEATIRGLKAETLRELKEAPSALFRREMTGIK